MTASKSQTADQSAPVARSHRITSLDVLRGFALLGILLTNINHFASPERMHDMPIGMLKPAFTGWHVQLDLIIICLKWVFVEGKMRALFAVLFGAGCILLTSRIEDGVAPNRSADIWLRRNMWLALFGIIHGVLIWEGDILFTYALCGLLFLYPFRRVSAQRLILSGISIWLALGSATIIMMTNMPAVLHADHDLAVARKAASDHRALTADQHEMLVKSDRRWSEYAVRARKEVASSYDPYVSQAYDHAKNVFSEQWFVILDVIGPMLLGMGLLKSGFLSGRLPVKTYAIIAICGYAFAIPVTLIGVGAYRAADFSIASFLFWLGLPYTVVALAAMLANASALLIIIKKEWLRPMTRALGAVGRTAFSNYIGTSLLCQWLFRWGPFHLYGQLEFYQQLYVVALVWAVNIVASLVWLRFFAFGPLEWLWRSLTYWRLQPLRTRHAEGSR
jgi:uncharacterized protein